MNKQCIAALCLSALLLTSCSYEPVSESFFALDTAVTVTAEKKLSPALKDTIIKADEMFSKVCGKTAPLNAEEAAAVNYCINITDELNNKYGGRLDLFCGQLTYLWDIGGDEPHVPSDEDISAAVEHIRNTERTPVTEGSAYPDLDLGAAAKGYALDMAYNTLETENTEGYIMVSAGSSILFYGHKKDGFNVGIRKPDGSGDILGSFNIPDGFVSTSGGYERFFEAGGKVYSHIFDTETGYPVETDLASVTVYIPAAENSGLISDLLSTMICCGGTAELENYSDVSYIAIAENGDIYTNSLDLAEKAADEND